MQRRRFLTVGAGVAATGALAAPAVAQSAPQIKWRIASSFPKSLDTLYGGAEVFAKAISEMTDGAFTAQISPAGELAPGLQAADAVAKGRADACHTSSAYYLDKDPAFALGAATPFGPNARQMNAWLRSGGAEMLDELYARFDLVGLACGNTGAQMGGWFRKDVNA
ncbi:MAG TPA: ABC transporter substrate-binding protein, partial [Hansschlegelia sp.]